MGSNRDIVVSTSALSLPVEPPVASAMHYAPLMSLPCLARRLEKYEEGLGNAIWRMIHADRSVIKTLRREVDVLKADIKERQRQDKWRREDLLVEEEKAKQDLAKKDKVIVNFSRTIGEIRGIANSSMPFHDSADVDSLILWAQEAADLVAIVDMERSIMRHERDRVEAALASLTERNNGLKIALETIRDIVGLQRDLNGKGSLEETIEGVRAYV